MFHANKKIQIDNFLTAVAVLTEERPMSWTVRDKAAYLISSRLYSLKQSRLFQLRVSSFISKNKSDVKKYRASAFMKDIGYLFCHHIALYLHGLSRKV